MGANALDIGIFALASIVSFLSLALAIDCGFNRDKRISRATWMIFLEFWASTLAFVVLRLAATFVVSEVSGILVMIYHVFTLPVAVMQGGAILACYLSLKKSA